MSIQLETTSDIESESESVCNLSLPKNADNLFADAVRGDISKDNRNTRNNDSRTLLRCIALRCATLQCMALYCSALNLAQHRLTDWYTRSLDDYDYYFHYYLLSALVRLTLQCRIL